MTGARLGKREALLVGAVPAGIAALAVTRTWLTGRSADPVLGSAVLEITGTAAAPAILPLALVALAGTIAILTVGRVARLIALVLLGLASVWMVASAAAVINDPVGPLRAKAASEAGRIGSAEVTSAVIGPWPWVALAAGVVMFVGTAVIWSAQRAWTGLSAKYEVPDAAGPRDAGVGAGGGLASARRAASGADTWAALDQGIDPTLTTGPAEPDRDGP